jgi:cytochrome c553
MLQYKGYRLWVGRWRPILCSVSHLNSAAFAIRSSLAAVVIVLCVVPLAAQQSSPQVSFKTDIAPLLSTKCVSCHSQAQQMGALDVSTREGLLKGGQKGSSLVPGQPEESRLYRRITGKEQPAMPLGGKLSDAEVAAVKSWIASGAQWEGETLQVAKTETKRSFEKQFTQSEKAWWAFQKPVRHPAPEVKDERWQQNPVDAFIKAELEKREIAAAPAADRRTLIRRAYLDLIGLLPSPTEVEQFVNDQSPKAWETLIDRLLASPQYGERWARHWLDVARYADSWGHIHDDDNPNAWRYRDYVIKAFNEDKPYTAFIQEQLAGDELDNVTGDSLIATGFHRIGPRVNFREKQNPHYRYDYLDDMVGTTSRGFLGLSVNCARCHDHKFDPISRMDYYRMVGAFFTYIDYDHPLVPADTLAEYNRQKDEIDGQIKPLRAQIREIEAPYRKLAFEKKLSTLPEDVQAAVRTPEQERTAGEKLLASQVLSLARAGGRRGLSMPAADSERIQQIEARIRELQKRLPAPLPVAAGIRDGDYRFTPDGPGDEPVPGTTAKRIVADFPGSYVPEPGKPYEAPPLYFPVADASGKKIEVQPGFLSVIARADVPATHPPDDQRPTSGRRRALAEWIASPDNPLTARVMVNRIWHHHFGRGIVATPSNFGKMGTPPTHPKLLDWLATEFVNKGWSIKAMHRLIMNSRAYQMASTFHSAENISKDSENIYLWKFPLRRLEGEIIRDVILSAGGQLNPEAGGPPFFPALPASVREDVKKVGRWGLTKEEPATWRRSIYSYWKRALKFPMFEVLDQPDTTVTCERRSSTTVPTQALTLMNNEFVLIQSRLFAERILSSVGINPGEQVRSAYRIALSREPSESELRENLAFLERQKAFHAASEQTAGLLALNDLCAVILNLNEFVYIN